MDYIWAYRLVRLAVSILTTEHKSSCRGAARCGTGIGQGAHMDPAAEEFLPRASKFELPDASQFWEHLLLN